MGFSRLKFAGLLSIPPTLIIMYSVTGKKYQLTIILRKLFWGDCNNLLGWLS